MQTKIDHARILNAYLSRITKAQLEHILIAENKWLDSAMNQNNSAQLDAQAGFYAVISNAVNCMIEHDIINVERVINEELAQ